MLRSLDAGNRPCFNSEVLDWSWTPLPKLCFMCFVVSFRKFLPTSNRTYSGVWRCETKCKKTVPQEIKANLSLKKPLREAACAQGLCWAGTRSSNFSHRVPGVLSVRIFGGRAETKTNGTQMQNGTFYIYFFDSTTSFWTFLIGTFWCRKIQKKKKNWSSVQTKPMIKLDGFFVGRVVVLFLNIQRVGPDIHPSRPSLTACCWHFPIVGSISQDGKGEISDFFSICHVL